MDLAGLDARQISLDPVAQAALAGALILMMFTVALNLRLEHFRFFKEQPRTYLAGVLAQIVVLPALTVGLAALIAPSPTIALGMIVVGCCPGGSVSNMLTLLARGNIAYSVSLTATSSVAAAVLTPLSIVFWSGLYPPTADLLTSIHLNAPSFLLQTMVILGAPLLVGMLMVRFTPFVADKIRKPLAWVAVALLVGVIGAGLAGSRDILFDYGHILFPVVVIHNAASFGLGWVAALAARADTATRRALIIEIGIQNSGLALVILLAQLEGIGGATAVAGLWGVWHILGGLGLVGVFRFSDRRARALAVRQEMGEA